MKEKKQYTKQSLHLRIYVCSIICHISINDTVSDGATKTCVLNFEMALQD